MTGLRALLITVAALTAWALLIALTGGVYVEWHDLRISSRDPFRPALLAAALAAFAVWRYGTAPVGRELQSFDQLTARDRFAPMIVGALSIATLIVGVVWGTHVAGGADSYGYLSQVQLWKHGDVVVQQPIATQVPWPNAINTFTPLGYTPWVRSNAGDAIVPIYAPGLPMLMALFSFIHPAAVFWVVPIAGAAVVALTFLLGRALVDNRVGILAAVLMATSPAFLFQLVAPMSDVVIAACWVGALVVALPDRRWRWLAAGLITSIAILVRPNTAPIAAVFTVAALVGQGGGRWTRDDVRRRLGNALTYVAGTVPGVLSVAAIHAMLYGSPFSSGYGSASDLFEVRFFIPNVVHYTRSLVRSETPLIGLAAAAPFLLWRSPNRRFAMSLAAALGVAVWSCYLFYLKFDEWWYLRFLLGSFPTLEAFTAVAVVWMASVVPASWRLLLTLALIVPLSIARVHFARDSGTFVSWKLERRYAEVGRYVAKHLPPNAVLYSYQQSGSLRFYGNRLTLCVKFLEPGWLDRSTAVMRDLGYTPYLVFEEPEAKDIREKFGPHSSLGKLDWKPLVEFKTSPPVRIYDPAAIGR
jgi:Dolichyl-phosphate-mannose-protein mannosyltransferase